VKRISHVDPAINALELTSRSSGKVTLYGTRPLGTVHSTTCPILTVTVAGEKLVAEALIVAVAAGVPRFLPAVPMLGGATGHAQCPTKWYLFSVKGYSIMMSNLPVWPSAAGVTVPDTECSGTLWSLSRVMSAGVAGSEFTYKLVAVMIGFTAGS
jgi:hypothetical protein